MSSTIFVEAEWEKCPEPGKMLDFLGQQFSLRQALLFKVACCRRIAHLLETDITQTNLQLIELWEKSADGMICDNEVIQAEDRACTVAVKVAYRASRTNTVADYALWCATDAASGFPQSSAELASTAASAVAYSQLPGSLNAQSSESSQFTSDRPLYLQLEQSAQFQDYYKEEQRIQANLLRCIAGNPFKLLLILLAWLNWNQGVVRRLAHKAYNSRVSPHGTLQPECLCIFSDALEEAGCTDTTCLNHLRTGNHVPGCYVIDALLGFNSSTG